VGFARGAKRTLPFLVKRRSRLLPQPVCIVDFVGNDQGDTSGPSYEVILEAEDSPAWGVLSLNSNALGGVREGVLGGAESNGPTEFGRELTLAQRALIKKVAVGLAEDFARAVQVEAALKLHVTSAQAIAADEPAEAPGSDGLQVDFTFEGFEGAACISLAISAEALQAATKGQEEEESTVGDPRILAAVGGVPVELVVELGRVTLGLKRVLTLQPGQVLRLPTAVDDPVRVRVSGVTKFVGSPVTSRGQLAVEIKSRHED
jgi:flagellar motor switch protein FliM